MSVIRKSFRLTEIFHLKTICSCLFLYFLSEVQNLKYLCLWSRFQFLVNFNRNEGCALNINRTAWMGSQWTGVLQSHSEIFNSLLIVNMCSASYTSHTILLIHLTVTFLCNIQYNGKFCSWDFSYLKTFQRSHYHTGRQWVHNGYFPNVSLPWGKVMF